MTMGFEKDDQGHHFTVAELGFYSKGFTTGVSIQTPMTEGSKYRKDFEGSSIKDV